VYNNTEANGPATYDAQSINENTTHQLSSGIHKEGQNKKNEVERNKKYR
jgi:hypothetical protein